jgi:phosphate uptake regulator
MNSRKIQKTGGSSYTVTLPKQWTESHKLGNKSQLVYYQYPTGQLVFVPNKETENNPAELNLEALNLAQIEREIVSMYLSGSDEIRLYTDSISTDQRNLIRKLVAKFIGFELYDSDSKHITLKNVAGSVLDIKESLKRMLTLISSMYLDGCKAFQTKNEDLAKDIIDRDIDVDRIHLYIKRQYGLHLKNLTPYEEKQLTLLDLSYANSVGMRLERIADHLVKIAKVLVLVDKTSAKNIFKNYLDKNDILNYLELLESAVLDINREKAHKILDLCKKENKYKFLNQKIENMDSVDMLVADSIDRIRSYTANVAEEILDATVNRQWMAF